MAKKIYIRTFGCQMNERDSEWVAGLLIEKGFGMADSAEGADVVIFNTCSVRRHAEERAISIMGMLAKLKERRPNVLLGIMGCTAEYYGKELFRRLPHIDFICGTANIDGIPEIIDRALKKKGTQIRTGRLERHMPEADPGYREGRKSAYVSISRGCNNFCTYCIVPYLRGPERSRRPKDILKEIEALLERGQTDITLLGQNVNSYGSDLDNGFDFVKLLEAVDRLDGKKEIRFMTSHPKDASIRLFKAMGALDALSDHLHLPVQSGSDSMLKRMKRGYTSAQYLKKAADFRKAVPGGRLTTDIIVGFPGETKGDYEATKKLLKTVEFDAAYIFKYSPRPPAAASKMADGVPEDVKKARHGELLKLQKVISKRRRGGN